MSKLHSGTWIGNIVNLKNGSSGQFVLNIHVREDESFSGNVTSDFMGVRAETSPTVEGRYSPFGTLHLSYTPDESRVGLFDGRFETPTELNGVIWGTMLLSRGDVHYNAAVSLSFLGGGVKKAVNGHVWGK